MSGFSRDTQDAVGSGQATAVLVPTTNRMAERSADARLEEITGLARAIALDVVIERLVPVRTVRPATYIGPGQIAEIAEAFVAKGIALAIVDAALTPVQQRNLEQALGVKVIDRTGLILEIFGERAATAEGRLQVELAHLDYQQGRLVRSWTHLERQRGGFGFLGGPGETQIEADRRMIRDRMARLRRELDTLRRTRTLHRDRRQRAPWPVVALVGYTNAGKSTLFNRLTGGDVLAADMLFATLDPTMRQFALPGIDKAILSDTVGFVSQLPTQLIAAFRATLEEVLSADLIVHVRDVAHPDSDQQKRDVLTVLDELGVALAEADGDPGVPVIEVLNKVDQLADADRRAAIDAAADADPRLVAVSALTGHGIDRLRTRLAEVLMANRPTYDIAIAADDGEGRAWLYRKGDVLAVDDDADGMVRVRVRLTPDDHARFVRTHVGNHGGMVAG